MAKKKYEDDDGRTVADMNVDGFKWYLPKEQAANKESMKKVRLTRKEKRAITKASYKAFLPMFICIVASFSFVMLLMWLWLR